MPRSAALQLLYPAVQVLAVDHQRLGVSPPAKETSGLLADDSSASENSSSVITVPMNIVQVPALLLAQEEGHLTVALRAMGDELTEGPHEK